MAAAATLAENGARTLVLDEQGAPGGQIYRAIERNEQRPQLTALLGKDYSSGGALAARLRASAATLRFGTSVWRVDEGCSVWARTDGRVERLSTRTLVLATGAMERPVPIQGWSLPGVMAMGALQIMLKSAGLHPEGRLVLAGSGPLVYLFAKQCLAVGMNNLVLLDTAPLTNFLSAAPHLPRALTGHGWRYLLKGMKMLAALRCSDITIHRGVHELVVQGDAHAQSVAFSIGKRRHQIDCDIVGLHEGVIPNQQIIRSIGCIHDWDETQHCFHPRRDAWGRSSKPGIFVVGDGSGVVGAQGSVHDGTIAALAILGDLGRIPSSERDRLFRKEDRSRRAHLSVRPFLDRLYTPRAEIFDPPDPVIICRCESVRAGDVREVARRGCLGPNQAKAFLRSGMGPCQGRLCGPTVTEIIARSTGQTIDETGYYRVRAPIKPLTVGELAEQADFN